MIVEQLRIPYINCQNQHRNLLKMNKIYGSKCPFQDLGSSVLSRELYTTNFDKRLSFAIFIFPFLTGDDPLGPSYGNFVSKFICSANVCQGFTYHKLLKGTLADKFMFTD